MNELRKKAMIKEFFFEIDTRPKVVAGFFPNHRFGEYIMLTTGKPYRERVKTKDGYKFIQGR